MGRMSKVAAAQPRAMSSSSSISSASPASSSALLGSGNLPGSNGHIQRSTIMGIAIGLLSKSTKAHESNTANVPEAREDAFVELQPFQGVQRATGFHQPKSDTSVMPSQVDRAAPAKLTPVVVSLERSASFSSTSVASTVSPLPPAYAPTTRSRV